MRRPLLLLLLAAGTASADNSLSLRVGAAVGSFGEPTWAAPTVDLVGTHVHCARPQCVGWSFSGSLGYSPLDSHVFIADGQIVRAAVAAHMQVPPAIRVAGTLSLEYLVYHSDPDVLTDHPGIDLRAKRGGLAPALGVESTVRFTPALAVGAFLRGTPRELSLFEDASGRGGSARFLFGGMFLDVRLR